MLYFFYGNRTFFELPDRSASFLERRLDDYKEVSDTSQDRRRKIRTAISDLKQAIAGHGLVLIELEGEVSLQTAPQMSELIESMQKEELTKDLGKSALETLAIIAYRGPVSRRDVDYIRGVNSTFILRNLLIRGLIEKVDNETDTRSFLYKPTLDLVSYLGIASLEELPEYDSLRGELEQPKEEIQEEKHEEAA